MDKLKFIGLVLFGVAFGYLLLSILMPLLVSVTDSAANDVLNSPNAGTYVGAVDGVRYTPLFLYFVPAAVGITAIIYKLKYER